MKNQILLIVAISISFLACKNPEHLQDKTEEVETIEVIPKGTLSLDFNAFGSSAPIGIESVIVTGNKMSIAVKYTGGCEAHTFKLVGHQMVAKSLPPQRSIKLFHYNNDDSCRELIEEILIFDISAFAVGTGEVSLRLDSYDKPISYIPIQ